MRVLVCGGRSYHDRARIFSVLDCLADGWRIDELISGGATGADALAVVWALRRGLKTHVFRADWQRHGRSAGPRRNQQMLDEAKPDVVVAFPGGRGTADMVRRARIAGVGVVEITR